ncbi:M23 family metallopeptidase [Sphingomonas sp. SRS2]|uniref:M23 family metallopeptidase n=1 Tax=Sphingomonas sp. SRS2 TaxID=133190 RepID=UPI0006184304|nr:M23 family metallopeptidase [Sphingomonas sp. SRS2]KKC26964.1 peptidase M23 [Sphingomonas sp. SRS2]
MTKRGLLLVAALPLLLGAAGDMPELVLPIACKLGVDCAVQNYVDIDPSPGAKDFHCGQRTYDKHRGTDIRLQSMAQQRQGVAVLAAAAGTVLRARDGVADISVKETGKAAVDKIECGNGVVIGHAGGLETQYCHMAKGSITVKPGQRIAAGAPIGKVGLSGNTEYPHLHISVRKDGRDADPFALGAKPGQCDGGRNIWAASSGLTRGYQSGQVLNAGFATGPMTMAAAQEYGENQRPRPSRSAPALVAFVQSIGLQRGDVQRLVVTGPGGATLAEGKLPALDRDKAQTIIFTGKKRQAAGWPAGRYSARYRVMRGDQAVIDRRFHIMLD